VAVEVQLAAVEDDRVGGLERGAHRVDVDGALAAAQLDPGPPDLRGVEPARAEDDLQRPDPGGLEVGEPEGARRRRPPADAAARPARAAAAAGAPACAGTQRARVTSRARVQRGIHGVRIHPVFVSGPRLYEGPGDAWTDGRKPLRVPPFGGDSGERLGARQLV